jgi:hypothetical protein
VLYCCPSGGTAWSARLAAQIDTVSSETAGSEIVRLSRTASVCDQLNREGRIAHTSLMGGRSVLTVGSIELHVPAEASRELLATFRDDMVCTRQVGIREHSSKWGPPQQGDPTISVRECRVKGRILADRLELMGINLGAALSMLAGSLAADRTLSRIGFLETQEGELFASLNISTWPDLLASATDEESGSGGPSPRSRPWLLQQIDSLPFLYQLRLIVKSLPEAEIVLDITEPDRRLSGERIASQSASGAVAVLRRNAVFRAPVVVLTEGKTDAEFLRTSLSILFPHLTDLITFLDYDRRPEGGVGALVNNIRSFAAAGIVNRMVAIFDNDTAAADALRKINAEDFAPRIKILRYPDLDIARNYPAIGPPGFGLPNGSLMYADVNGLAASIELYLGRDVLTQDDGSLQPIQWTSYNQGMRQYQGEITNKSGIQQKFREKCKRAISDPDAVNDGDWNGLRLILDTIRTACLPAFWDEDEED